MAEAVKGIDIIWLYRILKDAQTEPAFKVAYQTENGLTETKDADATATKDGSIRLPGDLETEGSMTSILAKGDVYIKKLRQAMRKGDKVEFWEINKSEEGTETNVGKFAGTYYQGYVTEYTRDSTAEDLVEVSVSYAMEGEGQDGFCTLTTDQAEVVQYAFRDTVVAPPEV